MASDKLQPLIKLGPFTGIDATTADVDENPDFAKFAPNAHPFRSVGALATARGRVSLGNVTLGTPTIFDAIIQDFSGEVYVSNDGSDPVVGVNPSTFTQTVLTNGTRFSNAATFAGQVYTNTGQQFIGGIGFQIQQPADPIVAGGITVIATAGAYAISGGVNGNNVTLYYAFTRVTRLFAGATTYAFQETSPSSSAFAPYTISVGLTAGTQYEVTLTLTTGAFNGTNADGSSYTTNIYRLSSDQPQWYLVGNTGGGSNTVYVDDNSQATIAANEVLDLYRDPPPASAEAVVFTHRDRLWFFVDALNAGGAFTQYAAQLWYSDYGVPYSFNGAEQVLLVGADSAENASYNPITQGYGPFFGDCVQAGLSITGVAILFKKRRIFILDGVDETTFFVSELLGEGASCIARKSVAACIDKVCWLSARGVEMWALGGGVQFIGEKLRTIINGYSASDRCAAVGWYSTEEYYISFPTQNTTFAYRFTQNNWRQLPYGTTYVSSLPSEVNTGTTTFNSLIATHPGTVALEAWNAAETDLGTSVVAQWTSPVTDSGKPWQRKEYRYLSVSSPGAQAAGSVLLVTLSVWDVNVAMPQTAQFTFALSGAAFQAQSIPSLPTFGNKGFLCQVSATLQNTTGNATYVYVWDITVSGSLLETNDIPASS